MLAFLFPGQGTQSPGMGRQAYKSSPEARSIFDQASRILGTNIADLCFGSRTTYLAKTEFAQPAIFVCNAAILATVKEIRIQANVVAGHSVGELSALQASGALTFEDGLRAVAYRGELMQHASVGAMSAIIGMPPHEITHLCDDAKSAGRIVVGLYNGPKHVVVSGDPAAVELVEHMSKRMGALRIVRLPTNRAFHSPLMQPVVDPWESYLASMPIRVPELPIVLGTSGRLTRDPEEIRQATVQQFTCPIQWTNVVRTLLDIGVTTALEVGESKTLRGLNRMIDRHLEARTTTDPHDMRLISMSGVGTSVASSGSEIT